MEFAGILRVVGPVAGIGGIAIASVIWLFRAVIVRDLFPQLTKRHAFEIIRLIVLCAFLLGVLGIGAWTLPEILHVPAVVTAAPSPTPTPTPTLAATSFPASKPTSDATIAPTETPTASPRPNSTDAPDAISDSGGGAETDEAKSVITNISTAPNLSILFRLLRVAGLIKKLSGPGPFTVFAPSNEAFHRLAPGTLEKLMTPAGKGPLIKMLTYHVVPGTITVSQLAKQAKASGGVVTLKTVEGDPLAITVGINNVEIADVHDNKSYIEIPDFSQSNGVVQVVNGVLLPDLN